MKIDPVVPDVSARIAREFHPEKVIVFGSRACGAARPDSDIDVLVVMPRGTHRRHMAVAMRKAVAACPVGKDIVVTTAERLAERGTVPGTLESIALQTGGVVYAR